MLLKFSMHNSTSVFRVIMKNSITRNLMQIYYTCYSYLSSSFWMRLYQLLFLPNDVSITTFVNTRLRMDAIIKI